MTICIFRGVFYKAKRKGKIEGLGLLPHASIIRSQLSSSLEVKHCVDRHVQQFISLPQAIPSSVVFGVQSGSSPVGICRNLMQIIGAMSASCAMLLHLKMMTLTVLNFRSYDLH